jgi:hypothetical protein
MIEPRGRVIMPYRTRELLQLWMDEFIADEPSAACHLDVLRHDGDAGDDTGLVIVRLQNAATDVYLQPAGPGDPGWEVHFGPRPHDFALSAERVKALSDELAIAAQVCVFLETRANAHLKTLEPAL